MTKRKPAQGRYTALCARYLVSLAAFAGILLGPSAAAQNDIRLHGGSRLVSVTPGTQPAPAAPSLAHGIAGLTDVLPLEGPLTHVAITITDQRSDEFDWFASAHHRVDGSPLAGATTDQTSAILDSGGATHLVSYPAALALGLQGAYLTANPYPVGGPAGSGITLVVSVPVGFFAHGIQDLGASGDIQPDLMFGQGNFASAVNTPGNFNAGETISTTIGAPFLAYFAAYIQNSARVEAAVMGQTVVSPSVTLYASPTDPGIPLLAKRFLLDILPGSAGSMVSYLSLFEPLLPSLLSGDGSLFFTADDVALSESASFTSGKMLVDTGSQVTVIGEAGAIALGLDLLAPDFEVEVQGVGSATLTAPGFYVDELSIPVVINQSGTPTIEVWNNVPVVVINLQGPDGGILFGVFGSNLTGNRDLVFNGALPPGPGGQAYVDISDPLADVDTDGDSLPNSQDNCIEIANPDQRDTDGDNIGNVCDPDIALPNDCIVNFLDLTEMKAAFFSNPSAPNWNPDADLDGDDTVNFSDLMQMKETFFGPPGPSGLPNACAVPGRI